MTLKSIEMLLGKRTMIVLLLIQKKLKLNYLTCIDVQSVFKERVEVKLTLKVDFFLVSLHL